MKKSNERVPWPYSLDGQAFVGEGRGAPPAPVRGVEREIRRLFILALTNGKTDVDFRPETAKEK